MTRGRFLKRLARGPGARRRLDPPSLFARIAGAAVRRAALVIAVVAVLSGAALVLALRLDPSAATDTFVDPDSTAFHATERFHSEFGDEPIVVLVRGRLTELLLTADVGRMLTLEGCLSGNVPRGVKPLTAVCAEFAKRRPIKVVYGPGTFINESARQISGQFDVERSRRAAEADQAARAARRLARAQGKSPTEQERLARAARRLVYFQFARDALGLAVRYGLTSVPALNNPEFVLRLVFEPALGADVPKSRFAYLFPSSRSAVIQARLRPGLSGSERKRTIELVRAAVAERPFKLEHGTYLVSGVPVVAEGVASSVTGALAVLLVAALLVMAATLALVFRARLRMIPLVLALSAVALTFGAMALTGAALTIASIAVLPVLIGLAVDYAIQFQARFNETVAEANEDPSAAGAVDQRQALDLAAPAAARAGAPVIATAAAATALGFMTLLLSPVPMVRSFAALLVAGIFISFACALTAGFALFGRTPRWPRRLDAAVGRRLFARPRSVRRLRALGGVAAAGRGAAKRVAATARRIARGALGQATARPGRVLAIGLAAATVGWAVDTQTSVVSDVQRLVPADLREIEDVRTLQRETGVSGDINVIVRARDLTSPKAISWMVDYQRRVLSAHGYREGHPCRRAELCPALSLTNLFGSGRAQSPARIRALLAALPGYFAQSVISRDRRTANISFGIRVMPLDEQKKLVDDMRDELDPPAGVRAELAGLPVLAADANADLEASRRLLTLAGLAAIFLFLLAVYRRIELAVVPLIPIALATGWSALILFLTRIPLNPLSATLGALVIAIATEFSVILSSRYRQERASGLEPSAALERTYERTGAAVLASAATATAGFAALIASDVRMLRDFGLVTVVDLGVSLLGVLVVLPAALVWAEGRSFRLPRSRREAAGAGRSILEVARKATLYLAHAPRGMPGATRAAIAAAARRLRARTARKRTRGLRRRDEAQRP